jgi:glycosyltransferase involved in cell wall biosynthesis
MGQSARIPISVIVLTKNEEQNIGETLRHLEDFSEVIVVDSGSTDDTVAIANLAGARVVQFQWNGQYPKKKQWSLDHAGAVHEWVLLLDADEYPTEELVDEVRIFARDAGSHVAACDISLRYRFAGEFLKHGHVVSKRSLVRPAHCRFPEVPDLDAPGIREVEGHYQPMADGRIDRLKARLVHDDCDPVASWFDRHNRYSDWEAHLRRRPEQRQAVAKRRSSKGRFFDAVPGKPLVFFLYSYVFRAGFLDRRAGFDYAFALTAYYWQIGVKTNELARREDATPKSMSRLP